MKFAAIPTLRGNPEAVAQASKQNLDLLTGQHPSSERLKELTDTATTDEIREMLNAVIRRLNGS